MAPKFKIIRQYVGKSALEVSEQEARERLAGYYPDIKATLRAMWGGQKFRTMGGLWWIERIQC
jgi:hypothetical protein